MRKIYMLSLLAFSFVGNILAQDILVVTPGSGTLNAAVAANGGNKIYQLTAGEWYGLDAPIENVDYHLQIIGSEPAVAGGKPATLQTGSDVNGAAFDKMFDAKGNITLKNIYFVNADLTAQVANQFLVQSKADSRVVIDRCILHPACVALGINGQGGNIKTYFTNNQVIDHGHQLSPNDGHFFAFDNTTGIGLDTLWVENNTFVCMGMNLFQGSFGNMVNNVVNFNHNTFVMTKSQIDWTTKKMEQYWTNNLMFDVQTQAYANNWQPMPGGDAAKPKPNLIYADTLANEVLPSTRPNFVQYNSHYRAQGFYDLITELNVFSAANALPGVYLYPLVWPADTLNSREAQMFVSDDFPKFKYGNTITDVDPQWVDAKIYEHEANFILWTKPASYIHALGQPAGNYPAATEWAQWWWIPSGDISDNSVWPVFNGVYTNEQTLKGSIEKNVPLGDLNWFPEAKTAWEAKKAAIQTHIKNGNEFQINIGYMQEPAPTAVLKKVVGTPEIDGTVDAFWADVPANSITRSFVGETPTIGAAGTTYWKAVWNDQGVYVLVNVNDDVFSPWWAGATPGEAWWYDQPEVYMDVNAVLKDGDGPGGEPWTGSVAGHHQFAPKPIEAEIGGGTPLTTGSNGSTFAFKVANPAYVTEYFVPFTKLLDKDGAAVNKAGVIGFDVYVIDNDVTATSGRKRAVWSNEGVINESYNNMDDCGTITLGSETVTIVGVSNVNALGQSAYIANDMLKFKGYDKAVNVEVYSILGQKVISAKNITEVNVSELAKGVYMVRVNDGKHVYKVMK